METLPTGDVVSHRRTQRGLKPLFPQRPFQSLPDLMGRGLLIENDLTATTISGAGIMSEIRWCRAGTAALRTVLLRRSGEGKQMSRRQIAECKAHPSLYFGGEFRKFFEK